MSCHSSPAVVPDSAGNDPRRVVRGTGNHDPRDPANARTGRPADPKPDRRRRLGVQATSSEQDTSNVDRGQG